MDTYAIQFSGGRSSAMMTNEYLKEHPETIVSFQNTGKEKAATLKFVHECDQLWGGKVVWLEYCPENRYKVVSYETASRKGEPFAALIKKRKFLPNVFVRYCTQELKIRVFKRWMIDQGVKHWINLIGIRYDEPLRYNKVKNIGSRERDINEMPLVKWGVVKADVLQYWKGMPFDLELKDYEGNCDACFLKGAKKKMQIIRDDPSVLDWWVEQENLTGSTFHSGYSYKQLIQKVNSQPQLFTIDNDVECFCNID